MLSPDQIDATYKAATQAVERRDFTGALALFRQVAEARPDHVEAQYQIGRILIAGDRAGQALAALRKAAELRPEEPAIWQAMAEAVALGGDAEDEKRLLAGLKAARLPAEIRLSLQERFGAMRKGSRPATGGVAPAELRRIAEMMRGGDAPQAEAACTRLLRTHPQSAALWNLVASAQSAQGKYPAAQAGFARAVQIDPRYSEAYENMGFMLLRLDRTAEAISTLRKAVILSPGRASALRLLGEALLQGGEAQSALPPLERAARENPQDPHARAALGNAYARALYHEEAEAAFEAAATLSGDAASADLLAQLGSAQARNGRDAAALESFDRALASAPDHPLALSGKAGLLQTQGDFDAAKQLFLRAIEVDPANGENYRQLIAAYKVKPGDALMEKMQTLYEGDTLRDNARMNVGFAIAKGLEDTGAHDKVFRYLDEANALMRKSAPYAFARRLREVKGLRDMLGDFDYLNTTIDGTTDFAPIFVTGMPRSGTTLVEQIISSHSTVSGGGEQSKARAEANALLTAAGEARTLADIPPAQIAALGQSYADHMRGAFPGVDRLTDKAIGTYNYIGLLRLAMPRARFVVVRRDPRDTLLSIYKNKFPDGTHGYAYDQQDLALYYSTFVEMVDFWRARVPDWFYEVEYEALVSDPEAETRKLIAACGLEWEDACLSFHTNTRKVQTLSVYQVRQPISKASVQAWRRYEQHLAPMLDQLRKDGHVAD